VDLIGRLAAVVADLCSAHDRVLVGIDGPDAAGKTVLADELAAGLQGPGEQKVPVLRASFDGFHRPRSVRYRRGELSAEGYYHDSFDEQTLRGQCLLPFRSGAARVRTSAYDYRGDVEDHGEVLAVPARAVLIVDGVFLLHPSLRACWTLSAYLRISPQESLRRALRRDVQLFGSSVEPSAATAGATCPGRPSTAPSPTPRGSRTSSSTTNTPNGPASSDGASPTS
jgi:uridine kinase